MPVPVGPWPWLTVGKLRQLFVAMGCEYRELDGLVVADDGTTRKVRLLLNPETDGVVAFSNYDDDERVPWSEVEQWERSLAVSIPRGPGH